MAPGTTALRLGDYNQQVVLDVIRTVPGVSRTDIAERTGLTAQAISKIVRRLADQDLIQESGTTIPSTLGGRPATGLCINPGARYAVGVHVDRDETAYTLLDLRGTIVARNRRTTPQSGPAAVVRQVAGEVPRLLQSADVPPAKVLGIGVGAPGPLDPVEGVLHSPPGMRGWGTVPLRDLVRERTGSPVWLDNDAVAAAIGESWNARTGRAGSMLFVYLGWGVGAALLIDGHPHRGSTVGSDLYHVPVDPKGPLCACGSRRGARPPQRRWFPRRVRTEDRPRMRMAPALAGRVPPDRGTIRREAGRSWHRKGRQDARTPPSALGASASSASGTPRSW
jgi:hypothetical protein